MSRYQVRRTLYVAPDEYHRPVGSLMATSEDVEDAILMAKRYTSFGYPCRVVDLETGVCLWVRPSWEAARVVRALVGLVR